MAAGMDAAAEAGLKAVLALNPNQFGTPGSGSDVMDNIVDSVLLNVTGGIDPLSAGTGAGPGFSQFSDTMFFGSSLAVIEDGLGALEGGLFGDFLGSRNRFSTRVSLTRSRSSSARFSSTRTRNSGSSIRFSTNRRRF
jgi:hypothetical protein